MAILTLLLICAVWYVYLLGWFDVAFFARTDASDDALTEESTYDETSCDVSSYDTSEDISGVDSASDAETTADASDPGVESGGTETVFGLVSDYEALGYSLSTGGWGEGFVLASAGDIFGSLPSVFSYRDVTVSEVSYLTPDDATLREAVYTDVTEAEASVTLYMGYVIVSGTDGVSKYIYTQDGVCVGYYDGDEIAPAYQRDMDGNPLFIYKDAYYCLDEDACKFVESDYDPDTDDRGAHFDYLSSYGTLSESRYFDSDWILSYTYEDIEGEFDENGYQLAYQIPTYTRYFALFSTSKRLTDYIYTRTWNFSESLAPVTDENGWLYYITRSGKTAFAASNKYTDSSLGRKVIEFYLPPLTDGEESIGFYHFENGLVRIRRVTIDNTYYNRENNPRTYVYTDEDILIYSDGTKFATPSGYEVVAYSSGMILLKSSSDGKYGYMDYTGAWVVQPTLSYAEPFYEGLAVVGEGGERALIDTSGSYVIGMGEYSYISNASSGIIAVYGDEGWCVLYKMEAAEENE
ncbi:MAG: WG repeat-containing protein [Firmicutes bacterium]|nr:WG repeat-containing protein [Bacillota bacterium]